MTKILVLTSEIKTSTLLKSVLAFNNFHAFIASSIVGARSLLEENTFSSIIIDYHLGMEELVSPLSRYLRQKRIYLPILYLGVAADQKIILKKCTGLDEFLISPFRFQDLMTKLNKTIEKSNSNEKPLLFGGVTLDARRMMLSVKDKMVRLGKNEMKILAVLARKAGRVVSIQTLHALIIEDSHRFETRIFCQITSLRRKLENLGVENLHICSVKDGYRLDVY
jgi:DNA-binding response OmpR family regulator